jgi:hypothetical protein
MKQNACYEGPAKSLSVVCGLPRVSLGREDGVAKKLSTIADLRKLLAAKEEQLTKLTDLREKLRAELAKVEAGIAQLAGAVLGRGRRAAPAQVRRGRPRGGRQGLTLKQAIAEIFGGGRKPLGAKDIAEALPGVGYVSRSKNLLTMITSTLSRTALFRRVARGKYRLVRRRGRPPGSAKAKARAKAPAASQAQPKSAQGG